MSKEKSLTYPEVDCSILNLLDASIVHTVLWPVDKFVDTIRESGYRGLEWHPLRGIVAGMQMNAGLVSKDARNAVISLHQSHRSEKSIGEVLKHKNPVLAAYSYILLPERVSSLDNLEHLQGVIGRELPVILFPPNSGEESGTGRGFGAKLFQPTPEVMHRWQVKTPEQLINRTFQEGYTGLCLDLFHMRAREISEYGLNPWQETLPKLLPYTQEVHVAAGRVDIKQGNNIDTVQELEGLLKGNGDTELINMLKEIKTLGWTGQVVTEIPAVALRKLRASRSSFLSIANLIEDHRKIVGKVKDCLT